MYSILLVLFRWFYRVFTLNTISKWNRLVPLGDLVVDRNEKAMLANFGSSTTVYDSCLILGDVSVGSNTWIGPNTLLDGSGFLSIGDNCSISAGVQIYTHDSVDWAISNGKKPYSYASVSIGDCCYIGPNSIISKGINIGSHVIIGANSFVNSDIPSGSKAWGSPAKVVGSID